MKRKGKQGIVPVLLWYGLMTDSGSAVSVTQKYSYDGEDPTFARLSDGKYRLTLNTAWSDCSFSGGKVIPSITTYGGTTGVSARIEELRDKYITIETANDNKTDNSNIIVKLEYIG